MADHRLLNNFLRRFLTDQISGQVLSLEEYQELFPGNVELIAEHYARYECEGGVSEQASQIGDDEAPASRRTDRIGPYRILRELGRGGQGVVYLAEDDRLQRRVALKILTGLRALSEDQVTRFLQEAQVASRVNHPNVCTVYDTGTEEGIPYLAMQYVEGETLSQKIHTAHGSGGSTAFSVSLTDAENADSPAPSADGESPAPESASREEILRIVGPPVQRAPDSTSTTFSTSRSTSLAIFFAK